MVHPAHVETLWQAEGLPWLRSINRNQKHRCLIKRCRLTEECRNTLRNACMAADDNDTVVTATKFIANIVLFDFGDARVRCFEALRGVLESHLTSPPRVHPRDLQNAREMLQSSIDLLRRFEQAARDDMEYENQTVFTIGPMLRTMMEEYQTRREAEENTAEIQLANLRLETEEAQTEDDRYLASASLREGTQIPDDFRCPLTLDFIRDPCTCGTTCPQLFEYEKLAQWIVRKSTHPTTREQVGVEDIHRQPDQKQRILEWVRENSA
jgi:hypothetical protein